VNRKIDHISWDMKPGDLVITIRDCRAIPDVWEPTLTLHEGNTPRLYSHTIGLVVSTMGGEKDEYPLVIILIGEKIYGVKGLYLDLATKKHS